jgi:hypothetical protein
MPDFLPRFQFGCRSLAFGVFMSGLGAIGDNGKMAWFPCYVNDLLGSMRWKCMTAAERGAYWQLICWQMQSDDGHLPADVKTLSTLADLDLTDRPAVIDAFPVNGNGKRANLRALKEWGRRMEIGTSRSNAASTAANSRWHKQRMRDACATHSKRNASECTATATSTATSTDTSKESSSSTLIDFESIKTRQDAIAVLSQQFPNVSEQAWIAELGAADWDKAAKSVQEFLRDELNSMEPSARPTARLRAYIRNGLKHTTATFTETI